MPIVSKSAKSPKSNHRKMVYRDALSVQAFEGLAEVGGLGPDIETVVIEETIRLSTWTPGPKAFNKTRTKPYKRWQETSHPTKAAYRTATPWRDAKTILKVQIAHWTLKLDKAALPVWSFTLNLGSDIEALALAKGFAAKDWLAERMNYHFKNALARKPQFWFSMETGYGETRHLHLHGEMSFSVEEKKLVREALRKVAGKWRGTRQSQIRFEADPDAGWVSYASKPDLEHLQHIAIELNGGAKYMPSWRHNRFFIEQNLAHNARDLYDLARTKITVKTLSIREAILIADASASQCVVPPGSIRASLSTSRIQAAV